MEPLWLGVALCVLEEASGAREDGGTSREEAADCEVVVNADVDAEAGKAFVGEAVESVGG